MTDATAPAPLNDNQTALVERLRAQADAAASEPERYSRGLFLGGRFCHRATVAVLERLGVVTVRVTTCGSVVDLAQQPGSTQERAGTAAREE